MKKHIKEVKVAGVKFAGELLNIKFRRITQGDATKTIISSRGYPRLVIRKTETEFVGHVAGHRGELLASAKNEQAVYLKTLKAAWTG